MLGFIDGALTNPMENDESKKDTLIKGWIFDSLSEDVQGTVVDPHTDKELRDKLKTTFRDHDLMGHLETVITWTAKINIDSHSSTPHSMGENIQFVEKLAEKISSESLLTLVNNSWMNSLHVAAQVGNTAAAKMLVGKTSVCCSLRTTITTCLSIQLLPVLKETLFNICLTRPYNILRSPKALDVSPFENRMGGMLLANVIDGGFIGEFEIPVTSLDSIIKSQGIPTSLETFATHKLMDKYPNMATKNLLSFLNTDFLSPI